MPGTPWPEGGPFDFVALRLPRGKEELAMALHAAASVLKPQGTIFVFGANDEGIQSAVKPLGSLFSRVETLGVGGRCRILSGGWNGDPGSLRGEIEDWRTEVSLDFPGLPVRWCSYPGVFAHGRLDPGTRLLLETLPELPPGTRVLDYGCGSGPVAYMASSLGTGVEVDLLDVDSVALLAAGENVPNGRLMLGDGLPPPGERSYTAILSNPPFHRGKAEEPGMIEEFVQRAPSLLARDGTLAFVAQKRLSVHHLLRAGFRQVDILGDDRTYRVWRGRGPRR
jgi:16S rRNA (guanine1207-N2)-methyltransferase